MLSIRSGLPKLEIKGRRLQVACGVTSFILIILTFSTGSSPRTGVDPDAGEMSGRLQAARDCVDKKDFAQATEIYQRLLSESAHDCKLRAELSEARRLEAQAYIDSRRNIWPPIAADEFPILFAQALAEQIAAYELCPGDPGIRDDLARLYYVNRQYEGAIRILEEDLQADPNNLAKLRMLALLEMRTGNDESAAIYYEHLLELDPGDEMARLRFAQCLRRVGAYGEAEHQMDEYRRIVGVDRGLRKERDQAFDDMRVLSRQLGIELLWDDYARQLKEGRYEDALASLSTAQDRLVPLLSDQIWGDAANGLFIRTDAFIRNVRRQMED